MLAIEEETGLDGATKFFKSKWVDRSVYVRLSIFHKMKTESNSISVDAFSLMGLQLSENKFNFSTAKWWLSIPDALNIINSM